MKNTGTLSFFFILILSFFSFLISIYQAQYYYDGHHWGLMLSNAIDLINGKKPYEEIFIQYGILKTIFHAIFVKIGNGNVLSLFFGTGLFYFFSILLLYNIIEQKFNSYYAIFAVISLLFIHPFVNYPWHNYLGFFFLLLSVKFNSSNIKYNYFFSGTSLSLIILLYDKLLLIFFPFLIILLIDKILRKKIKKFFEFFIGFCAPIIIFFLYIYYNGLVESWISYQHISSVYLDNSSYVNSIILYVKKLINLSFQNILFEPYWLFFLVLIIVNINFLISYFFNYKPEKEYFFFISLISVLYIATTIHAINSFRFVTGVFIGIIILIYHINKIKSLETKYILISFIIFFLSLSINFKKSENNKLFVQSYKLEENIPNKEFEYFKNQKWSKNTWNNLIHLDQTLDKINENCPDIKYGINLTRDSYYYILVSEKFETFQKMPFLDINKPLDKKVIKLINKDIFSKIDELISNNNLLIISDKMFKFKENYKEVEMKYSYNNKQKSIFIPHYCNY